MKIPYELLIKYCRNQTSQEENEVVDKWLSDDKNFRLFGELQKEWVFIDDEDVVMPDRGELWQKIVDKKGSNSEIYKKPNYFKVLLSTAAVLVVFAISYWIFFFDPKAEGDDSEQFTTIVTNSDEKRQMELPDGTDVWINSNTSITFGDRFNIEERQMFLNGEIFVEVEPSDKPFVISTDKIRLEVLGTSFNVRAYKSDETIIVELYTGRVRIINIEDDKRSLNMDFPQYLKINKHDMSYTSDESNLYISNIWKEDVLFVDNEPLMEVMNKLESWYGVDIYYKGLDSVQNYTFRLDNETIADFLELFSFMVPIEYQINGREVYIEKKNE